MLMDAVCEGLGGAAGGESQHLLWEMGGEILPLADSLHPSPPPAPSPGAQRELCASLSADLVEWSYRHAPLAPRGGGGGGTALQGGIATEEEGMARLDN